MRLSRGDNLPLSGAFLESFLSYDDPIASREFAGIMRDLGMPAPSPGDVSR